MAAPDPEYERVKRESRDCRYCGGAGMLIVFHPGHQGDRVGYTTSITEDGIVVRKAFAAEVAAHCCCPFGVWMRDRIDDETRLRIPTVKDILEGRSRWLLDDPNETDEAMRMTPAKIRGLLKRAPGPDVKKTPEQVADELRRRKERETQR